MNEQKAQYRSMYRKIIGRLWNGEWKERDQNMKEIEHRDAKLKYVEQKDRHQTTKFHLKYNKIT